MGGVHEGDVERTVVDEGGVDKGMERMEIVV